MPTVRFVREGIEVDVDEGANLRDVALETGVDVYGKPFSYGLNCKGFGHCGTCRVTINPETREGASELSLMEICQFYLGAPLQAIITGGIGLISLGIWFLVEADIFMYGFIGFLLFSVLIASPLAMLNFFDFIGNEDELRLSCQVKVHDDIEVYTRPSWNLFGDPEWQYDVDNPAVAGHASLQESPPATPFEQGEMGELEDEDT